MCYAKPGPRCFGHADNRYASATAKLEEIISERREYVEEISNVQKEVGWGKPDAEQQDRLNKLQAKNKELKAKSGIQREEQEKCLAERDATKVGIQNLQKQVRASTIEYTAKKSYGNLAKKEEFENRLAKATDTYNKSFEAYDKEHGTVNGRQGSPYGTSEGVTMLRNKVIPVRKKVFEAIKNNDVETKNKLLPKYNKMQEQLEHAQATYERASNGKFDVYRASVASNKAELKKLKRISSKLEKELKVKLDIHNEGPVKALRDFRQNNPNFASLDSNSPIKKKSEQLDLEVMRSVNDNISPIADVLKNVKEKENNLETAITWGQMSDEDRKKSKDRAKAKAS